MNEQIKQLLVDIAHLEEELAAQIHEQQEALHYRIEGSKIRFEENLRKIHRELKTGILPWLRQSELRNVISAPFIYAMIIPFVLLDLFLFLYQSVCFPLFRIPQVKRANYVIVDRHNLGYLNVIEKLNCAFCGYADGMLAYTRQVLARTEMYWCPIKHARKVLDPHRKYPRFADFASGADYAEHIVALRSELEQAASEEELPPR